MTTTTSAIRSRRRERRLAGHDESGQSLVEMALVLPVVALIMAVAFNAWSGMQTDVRLTSAARAGVIVAANNLASDNTTTPSGAQQQAALNAATAAINAEEGTTGVYQDGSSCTNDCVTMSPPASDVITAATPTTPGLTIYVVTITITQTSGTLIPLVHDLTVTGTATARFS